LLRVGQDLKQTITDGSTNTFLKSLPSLLQHLLLSFIARNKRVFELQTRLATSINGVLRVDDHGQQSGNERALDIKPTTNDKDTSRKMETIQRRSKYQITLFRLLQRSRSLLQLHIVCTYTSIVSRWRHQSMTEMSHMYQLTATAAG